MGNSNENDDVERTASTIARSEPSRQTVLKSDWIYKTLTNARRRYICSILTEDTSWSLTELARRIAVWEHGEEQVTSDQQKQVRRSLYHIHIPKLATEDVVNFDESTETITPGENTTQAQLAVNKVRDVVVDPDHANREN